MTMRIRTLLLPALLLVLGTSCKRPSDAGHVATIDSLLAVTDSLINGMNAIDRAELGRIDSIYQSRQDALAERMKDTLNKPAALILANYRRAMTKSLGRVNKDFEDVMKELSTTKSQLDDLRADVLASVHEPAVEQSYVGQEKLAVASIRHRASVLANSALTTLREHKRLSPAVDSLLAQVDTTSHP